jgi:nicotinate-nucleotide pyrophosphorylase (carboxylating)
VSDSYDPPRFAVVEAVERALAEDLTPLGDITSALLPPMLETTARFVARQPGVLAGRACADETFRQIDVTLTVSWTAGDGDRLEAGQAFGEVSGRLSSVLTAERTALNFLGHLSGIATLTDRFVDVVASAGSSTRVWDTRKTTPGLRVLEKAAVRAGGGANHRGNLSDWVLLKDNHLALVGITAAVHDAQRRWPGRTVHVECDREEQVREAVEAGADALLLDNMDPGQIRVCVAIAREVATTKGRRPPLLEASGGISLETVRSYAEAGVDCISTGQITNSAPVLDIGLDIDPIEPGASAPGPHAG